MLLRIASVTAPRRPGAARPSRIVVMTCRRVSVAQAVTYEEEHVVIEVADV